MCLETVGKLVYEVCFYNQQIFEGIWFEEMTRRNVVDKPKVAGLASGSLSST